MKKKYIFINEEPNVNLLGLHPILMAFPSEEMKTLTGKRLLDTFYELDQGKMRFGARKKEWMDFANYLLDKIESNPQFEKEIVDNLNDKCNQTNKICKETLQQLNDGEIKEEDKKEIIKQLFALFISMCVYGLLGPIIEFSEAPITNKLNTIFEGKIKDLRKRNEYLLLLSFPAEENLDQKAQKVLSQTAQKIYLSKELMVLFLKENNFIKKQLPKEIKKDIQDYLLEWGWLNYSYAGPEQTFDDVLNSLKGLLSLDASPEQQVKHLEKEIKDNQNKQTAALAELKFNQKELHLIKTAQNFVSTKYLRAKMMFLADFTINQLLKSFAQKENLSTKQFGACTVPEVLTYFETGQLPSVSTLNQRLKYSVTITKQEGTEVLLGKEAQQWIETNVQEEKIDQNISEISGQVAYSGSGNLIKGVVKVVNLTAEMEKFEKGDILVSISTTPDIVPAMKKAAAIVTDIGGLTCHAAIVSRELNIPCVIGTKIATKVLKDGMQVEVDADKGLVRKVK